MAFETANENMGWYFRKYGASFLAVFSFLVILFTQLEESDFIFYDLFLSDAVQIISALILCILTIYVNRLYFSIRNDKCNNPQRLYDAVKFFYAKLEGSEEEAGAHNIDQPAKSDSEIG